MKSALCMLVIISLGLSAELTVSVTGIKSERGGTILLFLHQKSNWMKLKLPTKTADAINGIVSFHFESIPEGEYAIRIVHDTDKNGVLTMKWTPPGPVEGYGFSSNYKPAGIPKYTPASFTIPAIKAMTIQMIYPK